MASEEMKKPLTVAGLGCGARVWIYLRLLAEQKDHFKIVAAADPVPEYRVRIKELADYPDFQEFESADAFFAVGKIADILFIGTQDQYHFEPCMKALELGYDIVLEKPIAPTWEEVYTLEKRARELNRRVSVCHVLRYAPVFSKVKALLNEGVIGKLTNIKACEGIEPWHFTHSFVRGKWSETQSSNPILMSKCCHDLDIISWFVDADFRALTSFGSLDIFKPLPVAEGASRICPSLHTGEITTPYCALRYLKDKKDPWLAQIYPRAKEASDKEILEWLKQSPWGRAVHHCENDVMETQTVNIQFANQVTTTLTLSAFDKGRSMVLYGTQGVLSLDEIHEDFDTLNIVVRKHHTDEKTVIPIVLSEEFDRFHHEGGDVGFAKGIYAEMTTESIDDGLSCLSKSLQSHLMAFAADRSLNAGGRLVLASEYYDAF